MKKTGLYYLLLFVLCYATALLPDGFVADTLVSTLHGCVPIQELGVGDAIQVCTFNDHCASEPVSNFVCHKVDTIIRIGVDDDTIDLARDQLLFVPLQQRWLPASDIRPGMYLLGSPLRAVQVHTVTTIEQKTQLYAVSLNKYHNYLVGKHGIVVHNFGECAIIAGQAAEGVTFLSAFFAANPLAAPIIIGTGWGRTPWLWLMEIDKWVGKKQEEFF